MTCCGGDLVIMWWIWCLGLGSVLLICCLDGFVQLVLLCGFACYVLCLCLLVAVGLVDGVVRIVGLHC